MTAQEFAEYSESTLKALVAMNLPKNLYYTIALFEWPDGLDNPTLLSVQGNGNTITDRIAELLLADMKDKGGIDVIPLGNIE